MNQTTTAQRPTMARGALRGYATGVLITALFGFAWIGWGMSDIHGGATLPVQVVGGVVALVLLIGSARLFLSARHAEVAADNGPRRSRIMRRFGIVVGVEYFTLGAIAGVLSGLHLEQWVPVAICAGVGLHFLPLAAVFRVPLYYVTGAALVVLAVVTVIAVHSGASTVLWTALPGIGSAIVLWATSVILLRTASTATT
jgi:hypothetical protein